MNNQCKFWQDCFECPYSVCLMEEVPTDPDEILIIAQTDKRKVYEMFPEVKAQEKKAYQKTYRKKHKDSIAKYQRDYYQKNRDSLLEYNSEYRTQNRERINELERKRYQKKKQSCIKN